MKQKRFVCFVASFLLSVILIGCAPSASTIVSLSRERYSPNINHENYTNYKGKVILLASIIDKSGTPNLAYYSPDRTVGYQLFYTSSATINQPVVSFFWYALQKGFERAGIVITPGDPIYDAEMTIILRSVSDREIVFDVLFTKMGKRLYKHTYSVKSHGAPTNDVAVLEKRAYEMIDGMVLSILEDPDFKKVAS